MKKIGILLVLILMGCFLFAQEEEAGAPEEEAAGGMTFGQVVVAGGVPMLFIALCSVFALGLGIERFGRLKPAKIVPQQVVDEVSGFVKEGRYAEARERCNQDSSPISNILGVALDRAGGGKDVTIEAVEGAGAKEMAELQQRTSYLSVIAVISPMIGLLGTVLGMIQAFNVIAFSAGLGKPTLLAEGISKALVTTAAGLIVAIPAMAFYYYLQGRTQTVMGHIERVAENFVELLFGNVGQAGMEEISGGAQTATAGVETAEVQGKETAAKKGEEAGAKKRREEEDLIRKGKESYGKGDFKGALALFRKVLEINPDNKDAQKFTAKAKSVIEQMGQGLE